MHYIVEIEQNLWLGGGRNGDADQTFDFEDAKRFKTIKGARSALTKARRYQDLEHAKIEQIDPVTKMMIEEK